VFWGILFDSSDAGTCSVRDPTAAAGQSGVALSAAVSELSRINLLTWLNPENASKVAHRPDDIVAP
jgi:hypothetical protein